MHRDLKAENVFFATKPPPPPQSDGKGGKKSRRKSRGSSAGSKRYETVRSFCNICLSFNSVALPPMAFVEKFIGWRSGK